MNYEMVKYYIMIALNNSRHNMQKFVSMSHDVVSKKYHAPTSNNGEFLIC